jgi:hypothetical protein
VDSSSNESILKHLSTFTLALLALAGQTVLAQDTAPAPEREMPGVAAPVNRDKAMQTGFDSSTRQIETSLKDYLVAFDSRHDSKQKRVGVPLTTFSNSPLSIAYDLSGQNLMAQWKFSQSNAHGDKLNYQAYVGQSGTVSFVIRASF